MIHHLFFTALNETMAMHSILDSCNVSQVMPVEVDPPANIAWDSRDDWAGVLAHIVESGRTDFKPISTTSRGVSCHFVVLF
jgi:hypothetical protein